MSHSKYNYMQWHARCTHVIVASATLRYIITGRWPHHSQHIQNPCALRERHSLNQLWA